MKSGLTFIILILSTILIFKNSDTIAQDWGERDCNFLLARVGIGIPYSFYGMNLEYGKKNFGAYLSGGYHYPHEYMNYKVPGSLHFGVGGKYYFEKDNKNLRPNFVLHVGWIANYYEYNKNKETYKQDIYGAVMAVGYEYYMERIQIDAGLVFSPPFMTFNERSTLEYDGNRYFLHPSLSIGINLYSLGKTKTTKRKDKYDKKYFKTIFREYLPNMQEDNTIDKGACGNLIIYQQIYFKKYLVIKINTDSINLSHFNTEMKIDSANKNFRVFLMDLSHMDNELCCYIFDYDSIFDGHKKDVKLYQAVRGVVNVVINRSVLSSKTRIPYRITAKLTDLKLIRVYSNQNEKIYVNNILIWDIVNKIFCEEIN